MKPHSFSNSNYSNFLNFNIECNKTCRTKAELLVHLHKHSGNLPECWECGKKCASFSNLVSHVQLHTGEKPYTCQFCGKQFTQDAHLTRHLRLHTGKKNIQHSKKNISCSIRWCLFCLSKILPPSDTFATQQHQTQVQSQS